MKEDSIEGPVIKLTLERLQAHTERTIALLRDILDKGKANGELSFRNSGQTAKFIIYFIKGLGISVGLNLLTLKKKELETYLDEFFYVLKQGIHKR